MSSITWSFSSLKEYKTCARKYHANRVLKLYPHQDTEATLYGKVVHKAFEDYIREGTPLPKDLEKHRPLMDVLVALPGTKLCEHEMALKSDCSPCAFDAEDRWVRGIADLVVLNGPTAYCYDYKTGSDRYADLTQLELMALMLFAHYPEVEKVKGALLFTKTGVMKRAIYKRELSEKYWARWRGDLTMLESSYAADVWHPNPSGLCRKHCPCDFCEHHGG